MLRRNEMRPLIITLLFCVTTLTVGAENAKRKPEKLTMTLVWVADSVEPKQYIFVINGVVAYKTLDGLKKYLKDLPKGSTLTWSPGCCRLGGEPLLGSQEEMKKFKNFCKKNEIKFVLVPSG